MDTEKEGGVRQMLTKLTMGGGEVGKILTMADKGVWEMLTMADKGGRGSGPPIFG